MSDNEAEEGPSKKFFAEYAKSGRASCKHCKEKIEKGALRLAKSAFNPYGPGPMMVWHHPNCLFEVFKKQRASTIKIETPDDISGWSDLEDEDKNEILQFLPNVKAEDYKGPKKESSAAAAPKAPKGERLTPGLAALAARSVAGHKDNAFREFRRLCVLISAESAYTGKTALVKQLFDKGTSGDGFKGDLRIWITLLLPHAVKRVYNLQSKQLIKLFSRILRQNQDDMLEDLEQGDVSETISKFFQESKHCRPTKSSHLTIQEVDSFLRELSQLTKEDDQMHLFTQITKKCTSNDLMFIIRLVKNDLRINAGAKHILEALHPNAYQAFQASRDLNNVLETIFGGDTKQDPDSPKKLNIGVKLMTPVLPMLAEACKSVEQAFKKCTNGMYSEIKYDGERVQVHKSGSEFKFFSRSLKPVMPHKVREFHDIIPEAFPGGEDLILDSEILMIDTKTGQPLPFGTLGIHKKGEYKDACVCLFVFDCLYYNGKSLLDKPMRKRRKILHQHMTEIPNRILFSETQEVHTPKDLEDMMTKVFQMGLEGLVLKDLESPYEPGKRHWLKVKKDYLFGGAMADTADLVVLGAWFGTGQKGGMMSVFLMGCWDPVHRRWCTVTKVHTGHDDKTLERLQGELQMEKISKDMNRVPSWLSCTKTMVPDFVAKNPKEMPVWEITGAEFTKHDVHTASGISIRFPRVTKIRDDKSWKEATSLPELKVLYAKSKDTSDFKLPSYVAKEDETSDIEEKKGKSKKIVGTESESEDDEPQAETKSPCAEVEQQNSPQRKPTSGRDKRKRNRDNSPASDKHPSNVMSIRYPTPTRSPNRSEKSEEKLNKKPIQSQNKESGSDEEMDVDDPNPRSSSLEYSRLRQEKKRKDSGSLDSDRPVKKAKISEDTKSTSSNKVEISEDSECLSPKKVEISEDPESTPSMKVEILKDSECLPPDKVENPDSSNIKTKPDAYKSPSLKHPRPNYETFAELLASEMELLTDPVLYHRVKGELFALVHKAQQEQMKLIDCKNDLKSVESSSLDVVQISNGHDVTVDASDECVIQDKVECVSSLQEVKENEANSGRNVINDSPRNESDNTATNLIGDESEESNGIPDNNGLTDNERVPLKKVEDDNLSKDEGEVQKGSLDKESSDKSDIARVDELCGAGDAKVSEEKEVNRNTTEKSLSNSSDTKDELNVTMEISENSVSSNDLKCEDISRKSEETKQVNGIVE